MSRWGDSNTWMVRITTTEITVWLYGIYLTEPTRRTLPTSSPTPRTLPSFQLCSVLSVRSVIFSIFLSRWDGFLLYVIPEVGTQFGRNKPKDIPWGTSSKGHLCLWVNVTDTSGTELFSPDSLHNCWGNWTGRSYTVVSTFDRYLLAIRKLMLVVSSSITYLSFNVISFF